MAGEEMEDAGGLSVRQEVVEQNDRSIGKEVEKE